MGRGGAGRTAIGVRIEFTAAPGTRAVELRYRAAVPDADDPLRDLRHCFALWSGARFVGETCVAPAAEAVVKLPLPPGGGVFNVYLPEGQAPVPLALRAVGSALSPPRPGPGGSSTATPSPRAGGRPVRPAPGPPRRAAS